MRLIFKVGINEVQSIVSLNKIESIVNRGLTVHLGGRPKWTRIYRIILQIESLILSILLTPESIALQP